MASSDTIWPDSPLDAVDAAFTALTRDPEPLTFDLDVVDGDRSAGRGHNASDTSPLAADAPARARTRAAVVAAGQIPAAPTGMAA